MIPHTKFPFTIRVKPIVICLIIGHGWLIGMRTIDWDDENNQIILIDQTRLPEEEAVIECRDLGCLADAIKTLKVRGAPALGAAGAFGVALAAAKGSGETVAGVRRDLTMAGNMLAKTRPTAVNLEWGIQRVLDAALKEETPEAMREAALREARAVADDDVERCRRLGDIGAELLDDGDVVMTHCNAGRLACVDWGTALGVVRSAVGQGKHIEVLACETRPLNQGSRITAWELKKDGIPVRLISDSMSGYVMRRGLVDKVIVGADRITRDAVFNKIGTYTHSVMAKENGVLFYVAAPLSTFDFENLERDVEIEMRSPWELKYWGEKQIAPLDVNVINPAFDATPMENISAIITEEGILRPPIDIMKLKE